MSRKVGVSAEFPRSGQIVIGTAEAAIRLIVIDVESDGTVYFEVHPERGYFPGRSSRGRDQVINGTVSPGSLSTGPESITPLDQAGGDAGN